MNDVLTMEMVKRILLNVGASPQNSRLGLKEEKLLLDKVIKARYTDINNANDIVNKQHFIFAGQMMLGESKLRALLIDLTIEEMPEFLLLIKMDSSPTYAIYSNEGDASSYIRYFDEKKEAWTNCSVYMNASILANFERLTSLGILWQNVPDVEDLYQSALQLVN